jgi:hypothetical protein
LLRPRGALFLSLLESTTHPDYELDDWGAPGNRAHFTCYSKSEIQDLLKAAGFRQIEFSIVPSNVYESMPRLLERGVHLYQVIATTPSQPTSGQ